MWWNRRPRCPDSHRDFGQLAEALAQRATEEAARHADSPENLLAAVTGRMEGVTEEVYRARVAELLRQVFNRLDPQAQWQLLAEHFDDDTIQRALEQQRLETAAKLDPNQHLQLLIRQARQTGKLDISDIPDNTTLTVLLYDQVELFSADTELPSQELAGRTVFLKWDADEDMWCVLHETYGERYSDPRYTLEPRDFIEIGTWYKADDELDVASLHWGSVLKFNWNHAFYTLKMRINGNDYQMFLGQCILNGTQVWLQRPPGFALPSR